MTKNIVLICDDNYVIPTLVCLKSIIKNLNCIEDCIIHVCTFELSSKNVKKIESMSEETVKVVVDKIPVDVIADKTRLISQKSHVTPAALIKFELPRIFYNIDSILYLDSDIIVKKSLDGLLSTDLSGFYLAASFEFWKYLDNKMHKWGKKPAFFFNSGVMLLNLQKMREDHITEKLWDYKINRTKTTLMDQESFNVVCQKAVKPLSIIWNFNPVFNNPKYLNDINLIYNSEYRNIQILLEEVHIIHYVGTDDKPWIYKTARMKKYWDNFFEAIPFKNPIEYKIKSNIKQPDSFIHAILEKRKKVGISGLLSYIFYKIYN